MKILNSPFKNIIKQINSFRDARDWQQFHDPKNMAEATVIEASELLEHFLWKNKEEVAEYIKIEKNKDEIADEIADTMNFLLLLSEELKIDLEKAIENKLKKNEKKYPVNKSKGKSTKYTKLL